MQVAAAGSNFLPAQEGCTPQVTESTTVQALLAMPQQPTSLLSLPDELLIRIFQHLAADEPDGMSMVRGFTHVCRRIRNVAQGILYHAVAFGPLSSGSYFQAAVKENPSLGELVTRLWVCGSSSNHLRSSSDYDSVIEVPPNWELQEETILTLTRVKELILIYRSIDEASAVLAALPSPTLYSLTLKVKQGTASSRGRELWTCVSRFSELRVLTCHEWPLRVDAVPRVAVAAQHLSLPHLVKLHIEDHNLTRIVEIAGGLHLVVPSLRELHLEISHDTDVSVMAAIFSQAPPSLTAMRLLTKSAVPVQWSQYLGSLPALCHLTLEPDTFLEAQLLAYLPTAPVKSIEFSTGTLVTDTILQALTGPGHPPLLRQLCLNHIFPKVPDCIKVALEYCHAAGLAKSGNEMRRQIGPSWPEGATEEGLRQALAAANAAGIEVTGSALACANWQATFDRVYADFAAEQALKMRRYEDVLARFGQELLPHGSRNTRPTRTDSGALTSVFLSLSWLINCVGLYRFGQCASPLTLLDPFHCVFVVSYFPLLVPCLARPGSFAPF